MFNFFKKKKDLSPEEKVQIFLDLGFQLNEGVSIQKILNSVNLENRDNPSYKDVYHALSDWDSIGDQDVYISDNVWYFDTEAIEDEGSYVDIIKNVRRISQGELCFENIADRFYSEDENEKATLSFDLNGDHYDWEMKVDDDWIDPDLFMRIIKLSEKYNTNGRLTGLSEGGQDITIGWLTPQQLDELQKNTGLEVAWLEG